MKRKVFYLTAAVVMSMAILFTGCSSGSGDSGDAANQVTPAAQEQQGGNEGSSQNENKTPAADANTSDNSNVADNTAADNGNASDNTSDNASVSDEDEDSDVLAVLTGNETGEYKKKDLNSNFNPNKCVQITFNGDSITASDSSVTINGTTVTINGKGKYLFSGTLNDGQIIVSAGKEEDVRLILNGVNITCSNSSCIYVTGADKVIITLAAGTVNNLSDGSKYTYAKPDKEEPNAAIFSDCDLSINGEGTLNVTGNFGHAIRAKADIKIGSGTINLTAVDKGFKAKKTFSILDGTVTINAEKDGIDAGSIINIDGGKLVITAGDDAIQSDEQIIVNNGTVDLSKSKKGMKAPVITTNGGNVSLPE